MSDVKPVPIAEYHGHRADEGVPFATYGWDSLRAGPSVKRGGEESVAWYFPCPEGGWEPKKKR